MDFVIIGLQPWYFEIGSNCKDIALQLSIRHRVLYINMPLNRKTVATEKDNPNIHRHLEIIRKKENALFEIGPNLWNYYPKRILESINWIPSSPLFFPLYSLLCRRNGRRFASDIRDAARAVGFGDYILFNDNDIFNSFYLKEFLKPKLYIYYSRDNLLATPYWSRHGKRIEPRHIAKADIGVANSLYLAKYLRRYNSNSHYIGQGCDTTLFDPSAKRAIPADIRDIPHPIVGYVGAIVSIRIDAAIIAEIARTHPEWSIVLVGPEDDIFTDSPLHACPNVHFLGSKPMEELQDYIARFDVCINPQLVNGMTIGNYPRKVDEYLAMGKPVVATRTEAMQIFEDYVYCADKPEDYPPLIQRALNENKTVLSEKRISFARTHTWENSVGLLYAAIDKTLML
jgi:teichuronic acid biosynthesis glycosyltransferase TuaH